MFKPTKQQLSAINENGSILVTAAAGSGKTAVLVERVIRKLTDRQNPTSIDRMLIVTFTKASAEELKEMGAEITYSSSKPEIASVDATTVKRRENSAAKSALLTSSKLAGKPTFKISTVISLSNL